MNKLDQIIQQFRVEMGTDFIATDIVGMDGLSIAGNSIDPNFDSAAAAARFAMVMKLSSKVSEKLNMGEVEDGLSTTDKMLILTRFLGDGSYYWQLIVPRDATLGSVRMAMKEYAPQLWDAIPH
jgi:predicted regulator of Ras-like GTPase activity (Roadblock/LC7/MglB family)